MRLYSLFRLKNGSDTGMRLIEGAVSKVHFGCAPPQYSVVKSIIESIYCASLLGFYTFDTAPLLN